MRHNRNYQISTRRDFVQLYNAPPPSIHVRPSPLACSHLQDKMGVITVLDEECMINGKEKDMNAKMHILFATHKRWISKLNQVTPNPADHF